MPLNDALKRLKAQRDADRAEPWRPGKQPTDAQLIYNYIVQLRNEVSLARDEAFLRSDDYYATGQPFEDREALLRGQQGIFG